MSDTTANKPTSSNGKEQLSSVVGRIETVRLKSFGMWGRMAIVPSEEKAVYILAKDKLGELPVLFEGDLIELTAVEKSPYAGAAKAWHGMNQYKALGSVAVLERAEQEEQDAAPKEQGEAKSETTSEQPATTQAVEGFFAQDVIAVIDTLTPKEWGWWGTMTCEQPKEFAEEQVIWSISKEKKIEKPWLDVGDKVKISNVFVPKEKYSGIVLHWHRKRQMKVCNKARIETIKKAKPEEAPEGEPQRPPPQQQPAAQQPATEPPRRPSRSTEAEGEPARQWVASTDRETEQLLTNLETTAKSLVKWANDFVVKVAICRESETIDKISLADFITKINIITSDLNYLTITTIAEAEQQEIQKLRAALKERKNSKKKRTTTTKKTTKQQQQKQEPNKETVKAKKQKEGK